MLLMAVGEPTKVIAEVVLVLLLLGCNRGVDGRTLKERAVGELETLASGRGGWSVGILEPAALAAVMATSVSLIGTLYGVYGVEGGAAGTLCGEDKIVEL